MIENTTPETSVEEIYTVETVAEPVETITQIIVIEADRPFMTTSFEDYTVTEGFVLLIFVLVFLTFILDLFRR